MTWQDEFLNQFGGTHLQNKTRGYEVEKDLIDFIDKNFVYKKDLIKKEEEMIRVGGNMDVDMDAGKIVTKDSIIWII